MFRYSTAAASINCEVGRMIIGMYGMFTLRGMSKLVNYFETKTFPIEEKVVKTTIQVGLVRYRQCAFIFMDKKGIYLRVKMVFKSYPAVFIPWTAVKEKKEASLYGRKAIQLDFTDSNIPSVKFYEPDFEGYYNHLKYYSTG